MKYQHNWAKKEWFSHLFKSQGTNDPNAYFSHSANAYQEYRHFRIVEFIKSIPIYFERDKMLDIGCASGELTNYIFREIGFEEARGCDFVPELVSAAKENFPSIGFQINELPILKAKSGEYSLVVASEVLYYLNDRGKYIALDEIHRVLKKGGVLIVSSVLGENYFTEHSIEKLVTRQLRILKQEYDCQRMYHLVTCPFVLAGKIIKFIENKELPASEVARKKFIKYRWIIQLPFVFFFIKTMASFSSRLSSNRTLPKVCNRIGSIFFPRLMRSNIIIAALKE